MATNLSQIRQQLEMIASAAKQANIDLTQLNATLANLIRQTATGGGGTAEGIQSQVSKMLSGQLVNRGRIAAGGRTSGGQEYLSELSLVLSNFLKSQVGQITASLAAQGALDPRVSAAAANLKQARNQLVEESTRLLNEIAAETTNTFRQVKGEPNRAIVPVNTLPSVYYGDAPKPTTPAQVPFTPTPRYPIKTPTTSTAPLQLGPGAPPPLQIPAYVPSTLEKMATEAAVAVLALNNLAEATNAASSAQKESAATTEKLRQAPRPETAPTGGVSETFDWDMFKTKLGNATLFRPSTEGAAGILSKAGFDKIVADIERTNAALKNAELAVADFGAVKSVTKVSNDFDKVTISVEQANGKFKNLIYYVDKLGQAYTQLEYKEIKLAQRQQKKQQLPVSQQDLELAIGASRADAAYAEVAKIRSSTGREVFPKESLKSVRIDQPTNVAELVFETKNLNGVTERAIVNVDQWGNVMTKTNRRLMSFTQSIIKNTREVLTWSFGVGLVYGAYAKLGELIDKAIQNQSKLADVTIALGSAQRDVNDIFNDAQAIANETGQSVDTVIEAYASAYRAVGAIEEPTKRLAAANKLLADSTTLDKLSTLDASEAIDVLSGSLRQAESYLMTVDDETEKFGSAMMSGTYLLDRWVKLTKVANVDMTTLATAFSVTAESALNAGVSVEQLNAIIASLSEKIGGLGGKETGNAVRALIGGVYQQQAATALNQYGIAVQDVDGKMRNFLDISRDIYELYKQGIIDTTQLNKLGYTLGGGVRRGQQYVAFLSDYERIQELTTAQEGANGEAAKALAIKLDTLETSSTRLGNSFQGLAQTLGTDGGILDLMTGINTVGAGVIDIFSDLTKVLGTMTIPATLLTVLGAVNQLGDAPMKAKIASMMMRPGAGISDWMTTQLLGRTNMSKKLAESMGGFAGKLAPGLLMGAIPAGAAASEGKWEDAGAIMAGSVAGGLVGLLGGPMGSYIGATIGGFIAQAFVQDVEDYQAEFAKIYEAAFPKEPGATGAPSRYSERDRLVKEAVDKVIGEQGGMGVVDFQGWLHNVLAPKAKEKTPEEWVLSYVKENFPKAYEEYLDAIREAGKLVPKDVQLEDTTFYKEQDKLSDEIVEGDKTRLTYINELADAYRKELYEKYKAGTVTAKDYRQGLQQSFALAPSTLRTGTALSLGGIARDWEELSKIMQTATPEDSALISSLTSDIEDLSKIMDSLEGKETKMDFRGVMIDNETATAMFESAVIALNDQLNLSVQTAKELSAASVNLKPTLMLENQRGSIDEIIEMAKQLQGREFTEQLKQGGFISEEQMNDYITAAKPILIDFGDMMAFYIANGITDSKYIQQALEELGLEGMSDLGYQFMDVTQAQMAAIEPQYQAIQQAIIDAGGTSEETPLLTFFEDSTNPLLMTKDWKIVQYLLQEILKTEEKQLDGIYNLPSGASFYVPYQAWAMDTETRQAMAETTPSGPVELDASQFDTTTENFSQSVSAFGSAVGEFVQKSFAFPGATATISNKEGVIAQHATIEELFPPKETWTEYLERILPPAPVPTTDQTFDQRFSAQKGITTPTTPVALVDQYGRPLIGPGYGTTGSQMAAGTLESPLEMLIGKIDQLITSNIPQITPETESLLGPTGGIDFSSTLITPLIDALTRGLMTFFSNNNFGGFSQSAPSTAPSTIPEVQTNLKIDLSSQTQLIVDGRVLADVVKPYLYNDLVTYQQSAGTVGSAYVAA